MRTLLLVLAVLLLGGAIALGVLLNVDNEPPVDPRWAVQGSAEIPRGAVTVRFTGTSTLLFSDGETDWLVDGWFSRPGLLELALGSIEPDLAAIGRGLEANQITTLAAVIPVHSRYDHAMDAPEVAKRTGATLMGSESTANIGRGWGLPEAQIQVFENRVPVRIGKFVVTPIESRHFQFPDPKTREMALGNPEIREPLVPPVGAFDYRLGKAYVLLVEHPLGSFAVVGSAGYEKDGLQGVAADIVFLGIGGLGGQSADYRESFWRETVEMVGANTVIPIHYDSLTAPIEGPFKGASALQKLLFDGDEHTLPFLNGKAAETPGLTFLTLPRYQQVVLFAPE